jgi:hypothetical protein
MSGQGGGAATKQSIRSYSRNTAVGSTILLIKEDITVLQYSAAAVATALCHPL